VTEPVALTTFPIGAATASAGGAALLWARAKSVTNGHAMTVRTAADKASAGARIVPSTLR
jgi:hypothetical protein